MPLSCPPDSPRAGERGQASVEFVALAPVMVTVALAAWQCALAGHATWAASSAAWAAARAVAVGQDGRSAALGKLPPGLERGLRIRTGRNGTVHVSLLIPTVVPRTSLGRTRASAYFRPQS